MEGFNKKEIIKRGVKKGSGTLYFILNNDSRKE
jgi:hypothetical protein